MIKTKLKEGMKETVIKRNKGCKQDDEGQAEGRKKGKSYIKEKITQWKRKEPEDERSMQRSDKGTN